MPSQQEKDQNAQMGNNPESPYYTELPQLSEGEIKERSFDLYRLYQISQVRESALPQFDGMGYSLYNQTNEMADISYLAPKKNKGDTRITTGITHEKDSSLVSFFLNLNFEGVVRVFYKDKEMYEIGTALTKLVRKSREEEFYDDKRAMNYRNFVSQGTSFIREEYVEEWIPDKEIVGEINPVRLDKVKWIDKGLAKKACGCRSELVDGKKVFLEDIRQADIQKQPGVYTIEYIPRERVESVWGKTPRWKNVPYFVTPTATSLGTLAQGSIYSDWIWGEIDFNKVEVIKVYRPFAQRFQIYINGVPMLPESFPLKAISPSGLIPIAKGDADLMNMFAYSKSEPAKTKIDQAVFDEILQNMVMKFRQSAMVPRANQSGRIVTPDMFLGGRIVNNLNPDKIKPLIENPGITQSDFSFYETFKQHIDSKTISALIEGNPVKGDMTLGQYMDMQKKQILKIGGKIDGIVQWEKQMLRLRVMNLLAHGYQKDEQGNYKDVAVNDKLESGTKGLSLLKFTTENYKTSEDVLKEQNAYKQQIGNEVDIIYLDPVLMNKMLTDPDYCMYYEVVPVDKNNDKLTQMMFVKMITDASALFGPESLQVDRLKRRYASKMGEQFDDLFLSSEDLKIKQQQEQQMLALQSGGKPEGPGKGPIKSPVEPSMKDVMMQ